MLNIPAFEALKQNYPGAALTLAVAPYVQELAKRITFADEVITWENRKHSLSEILNFSKELKAGKYALCVIFNPSKEFNIISFLSGIPIRAGYNRKWGFLLNRKITDKKSEGSKHEVEYNLELMKAIGIKTELLNNVSLRGRTARRSRSRTDEAIAVEIASLPLVARNDISKYYSCGYIRFPLEIKNEDFSDARMGELGISNGSFIVMHPWASNKEKEWPLSKFKELAVNLTRALGLKIVLIGGREEIPRSGEFCQDLTVIDLTGKTNLVELAALLKRSKLLVTNDSGPMHLAGIVGAPVAAIFRKSPHSIGARRWGPVGNNHAVIENDIIAAITVDEVLDGIKTILKKG